MPNRRTGWMPDLSSASEYGNIKYIFSGGEKVYALPGPSLFKASQELKGFNPKEDFVLWPGVGDPAALFTTIIAIMRFNPEKITFLYWDRKRDPEGNRSKSQGFYVPCTITIQENRSDQFTPTKY